MRRLILACATVALIVPALAWAGGAGNPAATIGKDNFGVSIEAEEQVKWIEDDLVKSRRFVGKIIWGAMDNLDLYARLGASDLRVKTAGYPEFDSPPRNMTWGGGARYGRACPCAPKLIAYADLQMLSFHSTSTIGIEKTSQGGDSYTDEYYARYKYNEIQLSIVTSWQRDIFQPYIGLGITHIYGHVDREVYSEVGEGVDRDGHDFREDAIPELILGVDAGLGGTGRVSGEMRLSNESDISFFIGVSELLH
jgi:hypothetical protein